MLVRLRNPSRDVTVDGPISVVRLMNRLGLDRESHLVVCNQTLVPGDTTLSDDDVVEVRPVISGGAG